MITPRPLLGAAAGALFAFSVVGLATREDAAAPTGSSTPGEVIIASFKYELPAVTVPVGTEVSWLNTDNQAHTVTSSTEGPLDSGNIQSDGTYELAFDTAGSYDYFCALHPFMKGSVEVTG